MRLRNLVGCLILVVLSFSCSALGQIVFGSPTSYNIGVVSTVMTAADFNGDGYPDLAVETNYTSTSDNIVVLMNKGDGSFATPVTYALPNGSVGKIMAADLNGDGRIDLVAGGNSSTGPGFYVFINNGDGTFQSPVFYTDPYGGPNISTVDWSIGDFFTNGRLAVADHQVTLFGVVVQTNLWANDGTGKFTVASIIHDGMAPGVTIGDANGDGIPDFIGQEALSCNYNPCYAAETLGGGNGLYGNFTIYNSTGAVFAVADLSSPTGRPDGYPDVLASNGDPEISILVNNGDGTGSFAPVVNYSISQGSLRFVAIADLDGDGIPEIAGTEPDGLGNFYANIFKSSGDASLPLLGQVLLGTCSNALLLIDLNGDGLPDLISSDCQTGGNGILVFLNQTTPLGNSSPIQFAPPSLAFPPLTIGKTSIVRTITLNYVSGTGLLNVSNVSVSGDFALAKNNCPTKLAAGGSCTFSLTFTPTATGTRAGTLTVTDNQTGSPHALTLTGTGKDPAITFSPEKFGFPPQLLGSTSLSKIVKVTNTGIGDLIIASVLPSGNFATTSDTCTGATVPQGKSCKLGVSFAPSVAGPVTGEVTITDDGRSSPQVLSLSGTGLNPLSVSPTSLNFGRVPVGSSSQAMSATLTNNSPYTVDFSFPVSGDYSAAGGGSNPCGTSLPANSQCMILVTFTPTQNGLILGGLLIFTPTDFHYRQTLAVGLSGSGSGTEIAPLKFTPASLTFPNQVIGTSSAPKTVTVTNSSSKTVNILSFQAAFPEFSSTGTGSSPCGGNLLRHQTCTFAVTFGPSGTGTIKGSVVVNTDGVVSPQIYGLSGASILLVTIAPSSLIFAPQTVGTNSNPQTFTITNNQSTTTLNIASIVSSGQYTVTPGGTVPCGNTVAALGQCTMAVTFGPTAAGTISGVVTVTHDALGSPQVIKLTGTGQ